MDFITVDLDAPVVAFGLSEDLEPFDSGWHAHNKHQLLYAATGTMHLEGAGSRRLLPPQRAAWIGAQVRHRVRTAHPVALRTVYLPPPGAPMAPTEPCSVFAVTPL